MRTEQFGASQSCMKQAPHRWNHTLSASGHPTKPADPGTIERLDDAGGTLRSQTVLTFIGTREC